MRILATFTSRAATAGQARQMIEQALEINKALQRKKEAAANYNSLADLHQQDNDFDGAEAMLKEALTLNERAELKAEMAGNYADLARISLVRGQPDEAERLYKQAVALGDTREKISALRALGRLYENLGDPGQSKQMSSEARALEKRQGGGRLFFSFDLGLFQSGATAKEQLEALQKVIPLEKALGHEVGLASSYTLLGLHYSSRADSDSTDDGSQVDERQRQSDTELARQAEAMFRDALVLAKKLGRDEHMALLYRELAEVIDKRGDVREVEATLNDALPLYKKLGEESSMARLYDSLGYDRKRRRDMAQACAYWRKGALAYPDDRKLVESLNLNECANTQ